MKTGFKTSRTEPIREKDSEPLADRHLEMIQTGECEGLTYRTMRFKIPGETRPEIKNQ